VATIQPPKAPINQPTTDTVTCLLVYYCSVAARILTSGYPDIRIIIQCSALIVLISGYPDIRTSTLILISGNQDIWIGAGGREQRA